MSFAWDNSLCEGLFFVLTKSILSVILVVLAQCQIFHKKQYFYINFCIIRRE